jgi:hypothetical protein
MFVFKTKKPQNKTLTIGTLGKTQKAQIKRLSKAKIGTQRRLLTSPPFPY